MHDTGNASRGPRGGARGIYAGDSGFYGTGYFETPTFLRDKSASQLNLLDDTFVPNPKSRGWDFVSSAFDAIIEVGGTQQLVSTGRFYSCNSLNLEAGTKVNFERVLAVKDGEDLKVGQPYVKGVTVQATVMEAYRGKKEIVYKMKPKKHYRKKTGHRQELTKFLITGVSTD
eukprot:325285-Prorocentrum_minimum.AAC.3